MNVITHQDDMQMKCNLIADTIDKQNFYNTFNVFIIVSLERCSFLNDTGYAK